MGGQRNGYRARDWDTRVGTIDLQVPRVRDGSCFPSILEPRKRAERALAAVVQEAYVHGVSTRRVDDVVQALGLDGISKSEVARRCAALDAEVERCRNRRLEGASPSVWLDATFVNGRADGRVTSIAQGAPGRDRRGGARRGHAGGARGRCGAERGRRVLAALPAPSGGAGPGRRGGGCSS